MSLNSYFKDVLAETLAKKFEVSPQNIKVKNCFLCVKREESFDVTEVLLVDFTLVDPTIGKIMIEEKIKDRSLIQLYKDSVEERRNKRLVRNSLLGIVYLLKVMRENYTGDFPDFRKSMAGTSNVALRNIIKEYIGDCTIEEAKNIIAGIIEAKLLDKTLIGVTKIQRPSFGSPQYGMYERESYNIPENLSLFLSNYFKGEEVETLAYLLRLLEDANVEKVNVEITERGKIKITPIPYVVKM